MAPLSFYFFWPMAPLSTTQGQGVEVPPYFLCPISLQIMRDPVTLPTGITYDRDSIDKWVFSVGAGEEGAAAATCPVSKQPIPHDAEMTPNHTLRRLIQEWCVANASNGVERFPTPRQPIDKAQIARLLEEARMAPEVRLASLRKLRDIVGESERNRRSAESAGATEFLISVVWEDLGACAGEEAFSGGGGAACEEALCVLHALKVSPDAFSELVGRHANLFELLTAVLRRSNCQSRAYATFLLRSVVEAAAPARLLTLKEELFEELVRVIRDQVSHKTTKAALRILAQLCRWGLNRIKATKAGGVPVLVELLLDDPEQRVCEMALVILDQLCGSAEGRAELVGHAAGLAVVSKKVLRVSPLATERAVRVLHAVARSSEAPALLQEMLQVGVVSKLCLLLQTADWGNKACKEKAQEVLRLHSGAWKNSPCIPLQLLASFPRH